MTPIAPPPPDATLVGRIHRPGIGPALVTLREGSVIDITSRETPTLRDLLEQDDPVSIVRGAPGEDLGPLSDLDPAVTWLAPPDLQTIKASGVTFADSMVERVIEEQAAGDPDRADAIRKKVRTAIGDSLSGITPGSEKAAEVKRLMQAEGLWSQYLEVGIGPDAEVFTKCPPMAAVGHGAEVGLHPISSWNNPEPEIVLAVNSRGTILGATLGNDVNLRDVEGRSALLLGKAKDNNGSCAIGPFLRLFDDGYSMADVERAELTLKVTGEDGFVLDGHSSMTAISRRPADLVAQTIGRHHQYPDGVFLFLGTLFAPVQDRDAPGQGFTHKLGDVVSIREPQLGELVNTVRLSTECPPWTFGTAALMRNLSERGLL
ncbi:fumarylacetoacetate hydrolase family protein [Pseudoponticoccus marisrubri]|uniref:Fumarylacetoacetate hydrolase n=1 Tax=Pseudoponticoccus marisrubri TaxID=1685382 RepID=A0A0W7WNE1_9RHOB|nr:fumarylacetoacetate hydrolase family protein [Pseudoponticoccus marisrubri]KUF12114.1 fumarylacetoacetate hydrolase [Pseudoponticoccus marisrubri]